MFMKEKWFPLASSIIPCGLVARIRRFHRRGRGSIPRKGAKQIFNNFHRMWRLMKIQKEINISCLVKHYFERQKFEFRIKCLKILHEHIPCGLVARIRRFHRRGRGSIPRKGGHQIFT